MKLEFPKEEILPHLVDPRYKMTIDLHMHYDKIYTRQEFIYIKYAGIFILAFLGLILVDRKGFIIDYLIAVVLAKYGILSHSIIAIIFINSEIDWKRFIYEKKARYWKENINRSYFLSTLK